MKMDKEVSSNQNIITGFWRKHKINWDALGVATSLACAIHCAILPLVVSSLPIVGINILDNVFFEYVMILLAFFIGLYSLSHGYKKHHHRILPIVIFSSGIAFLLAKQIWHQVHILLLIPAVLAIITAHFLNYRFCRVHNHAHANDCNH
jgi:hypothetical protein